MHADMKLLLPNEARETELGTRRGQDRRQERKISQSNTYPSHDDTLMILSTEGVINRTPVATKNVILAPLPTTWYAMELGTVPKKKLDRFCF